MQRFAGGNSSAVDDIVTGNENWIYCYDAKTKRQPARCVFPFEELPTKSKQGRSPEKIWWPFLRNYIIIVLEDKKTVTAGWHSNNCLPLFLEKIREKRPRNSIFLHDDDAPPLIARRTTNNVGTLRIEIEKKLAHPPYSPDLVSYDF
ncbi:Mariner Mos1 transposase [Eumeta japonica]|uniref:Mariner Mos1 transposase n=1 Tax=Eumeta variegata TaxID=151549 RepID=A0A4C1WHX3_EUMVA|nr:Mariner Mos1 transposase [Eumeta japonica]